MLKSKLLSGLLICSAVLGVGLSGVTDAQAKSKSVTVRSNRTMKSAVTVNANGKYAVLNRAGQLSGKKKTVTSKARLRTMSKSKSGKHYFRAYRVARLSNGRVYYKVVSFDGKYRGWIYGGKNLNKVAGGIRKTTTVKNVGLPNTNKVYKFKSKQVLWHRPQWAVYKNKKILANTSKYTGHDLIVTRAVTLNRGGTKYYYVKNLTNSKLSGWVKASGLSVKGDRDADGEAEVNPGPGVVDPLPETGENDGDGSVTPEPLPEVDKETVSAELDWGVNVDDLILSNKNPFQYNERLWEVNPGSSGVLDNVIRDGFGIDTESGLREDDYVILDSQQNMLIDRTDTVKDKMKLNLDTNTVYTAKDLTAIFAQSDNMASSNFNFHVLRKSDSKLVKVVVKDLQIFEHTGGQPISEIKFSSKKEIEEFKPIIRFRAEMVDAIESQEIRTSLLFSLDHREPLDEIISVGDDGQIIINPNSKFYQEFGFGINSTSDWIGFDSNTGKKLVQTDIDKTYITLETQKFYNNLQLDEIVQNLEINWEFRSVDSEMRLEMPLRRMLLIFEDKNGDENPLNSLWISGYSDLDSYLVFVGDGISWKNGN